MLYKIIFIIGLLFVLLGLFGFFYLRQDKFGRLPGGERLERMANSPNYQDGTFHNRVPFDRSVKGGGGIGGFVKFLVRDGDGLAPPGPVPAVKTDLRSLDRDSNVLIWLGHSSYYMQLGGKAILVDPVFSSHASPISLSTRAFEGTNLYTAEDMPDIDYLLISHDHWDHLDYATVTALRPKTGHVIAGLGVGEHFARWGFAEKMVHEADWDTEVRLNDGLTIHVLTARHFSGRWLQRNRTLWVSFALETPSHRLYYSGDSGYGPHFKEIGERFGGFDLVMLDSGQYNEAWQYVHMTPEQSARAAQDLRAQAALPSHAGKFSIAYHSWDDPFIRFHKACEERSYRPVTPRIGEVVDLDDDSRTFSRWWESGIP